MSATGVAGLTLGGGIGWLVGKHGMTIDNLLKVDLVTADGEFLTVSGTEHPDLFWALRGGGGNFGVVTCFEFQLHPLDRVLTGSISYPIEAAGALLERYREFTAAAPDEITTYLGFGTDEESGSRVCGFDFCYAGDPVEGERVIEPLRRLGTPLVEEIAEMAYLEWQSGPEFPYGARYFWKSNLFSELPDEALAAIAEQGACSPVKSSELVIEHYHGAFNRPGIGETAYAHRDAHYQLVIIGCWDDAADDAAGIDWVRETFAATEPFAKPAQFLNFNIFEASDQLRRVRAGYGPNWDRLVEIKRRYDPNNVFRENNNIPPDLGAPSRRWMTGLSRETSPQLCDSDPNSDVIPWRPTIQHLSRNGVKSSLRGCRTGRTTHPAGALLLVQSHVLRPPNHALSPASSGHCRRLAWPQRE